MGLLRRGDTLMAYDDALAALGELSRMGERREEVLLDQVVGSVARADDFDGDFRPRLRHLRPRLREIEASVQRGHELPPVRLIRLGELYFVLDGHHRVSVARDRGQVVVPAVVQQVCTIAFAMCCIRAQHLASKAAERSFLDRVPLDDDVRRELWLDRPRDWARLGDAAEAWAFRHGVPADADGRRELADRWWAEEVLPLVERARATAAEVAIRDVEVYSAALAARDRLGSIHWPGEDCAPDLRMLLE